MSAPPPNCRYSTHFVCVGQVSHKSRECNHVCEGNSSSSPRPSKVLVSIDHHILLLLVLFIRSLREEPQHTVVFDQRWVHREGLYRSCKHLLIQLISIILTVWLRPAMMRFVGDCCEIDFEMSLSPKNGVPARRRNNVAPSRSRYGRG